MRKAQQTSNSIPSNMFLAVLSMASIPNIFIRHALQAILLRIVCLVSLCSIRSICFQFILDQEVLKHLETLDQLPRPVRCFKKLPFEPLFIPLLHMLSLKPAEEKRIQSLRGDKKEDKAGRQGGSGKCFFD